jgi:hypothetical protein
MKFSERQGITQPHLELYMDKVPNAMKTSLWNYFHEIYNATRGISHWAKACSLVAKDFRKFPIDELPTQPWDLRDWFKDYFFTLQWYETYNFLEFMATQHQAEKIRTRVDAYKYPHWHSLTFEKVQVDINAILESEHSGYRFVGGHLAPITSEIELVAISEAIDELNIKGIGAAQVHLQKAIELFSKRPNADYANSIKESISAIESIAKILGADKGGGLSIALRELAKKSSIHPSLVAGFERLYGYSSDEKGIRHALLESGEEIKFEEAKYMLVACSAFSTYLISKSSIAGLIKGPRN